MHGAGATSRTGRLAFVLVALTLIATGVACAPAPGATPPGKAALQSGERLPVVLVPGWELGCVAKADDWDAWHKAFVAKGLPSDQFVVVHYNSCQSNDITSRMIGDAVDRLLQSSGAPKVNLIAHSMGAISSRWCIQFGKCAGKVAQVVTVSGANHGTVWAAACALQFWATSCADMQSTSKKLVALNRDETPDGIGWETWVSPCEFVILPRESTFLDGAVNHDLVDQCVDHSGWKWFKPTIETVTARLMAGRQPAMA